MIGTLTKEQSEHVLRSGLVGRIGCADETGVYIVPVTYVYEGNCIYAHSKEGLKVRIMRKNPMVCFEVDSIENMTNWRSVIIQGKFEEIDKYADQTIAFKILRDRLMPYLLSETMRPKGFGHELGTVERERKPVVYRITIEHMSGRFEKNSYASNLPH